MCDPDRNSSDQCQGHINIGMVSVGHIAWFLETCWRACCRAFVGMSCVSTVFILIQYNQNRKILAYDLLVNFLESACVKSWTTKVTLLSLTFSPRQKATGWPCSSKTGWPSLTRPSFPSKRGDQWFKPTGSAILRRAGKRALEPRPFFKQYGGLRNCCPVLTE